MKVTVGKYGKTERVVHESYTMGFAILAYMSTSIDIDETFQIDLL
jgi:hypothetical protein